MDLGLKDRIAIVTGGSMGLGRAVARELARERARVVIAARNEQRLQRAAEEIRRETGGNVLAVRTDMTRPEEIRALVEQTVDRWGGVDIALANAGGPPGTRYESTSAEQVERALELNLMSTVRLAQEVTPLMKQKGWGRFIALTSVSVKQPLPGLILSNTARAAVVGWVKTMATELAPHGITCNVVAPGYMHTGRVEDLAAERAEHEFCRKRRGVLKEEKNAMIRLADAVCGLARMPKDGQDWAAEAYGRLLRRGLLMELLGKKKSP